MPSADEILDGLSVIAGSWRPLAVLWHAYFAVLAGAFLLGWRPRNRMAGALLIPPVISVSVLAWIGGNAFNGTIFGLLSAVLVVLARRLGSGPAKGSHPVWVAAGALLFAFAWVYPHFIDAESVSEYLYAAPLGLVPCPTLSMIIGIAIVFRGLGSLAWSLALVVTGLFYGVFGSLHLGVTIDWALTGGALCLLGLWIRRRRWRGEGAG